MLRGGENNDWLYLRTRFGGSGFASAAHGDGGSDHIYGSMHRDYLTGGSGGDWIEGAEGDDLLVGDSGGDVLLGGDGGDQLDGGFDNIVDLLAGGAQADTYFVHFLNTNNVQLDGTPRSVDIQPEAFVHDGTDRVVFIPHEIQAVRSVTLPNTSFDGSTAWLAAGILDGSFGEAEVYQAYAADIVESMDDAAPMPVPDADLQEHALRDLFGAEDSLIEAGMEMDGRLSISSLLDETESLGQFDVIDQPVSIFAGEAAMDESDLVTARDLTGVSYGSLSYWI